MLLITIILYYTPLSGSAHSCNNKGISTAAGDRAGANLGKILIGLNDTNAMATLTIGKDIIEPNTNYQAQNDYKR